jgi:hypothetical protein
MRTSFTSSFKRYLAWFALFQIAALSLAFGASMVLVKDYVEPHDRVIESLTLVQSATARNAAFGDSHFAWGFVGSPDLPTLGAEGETVADMELRVKYYFRDKQPGKVIIQGDPHSFAAYKLDRSTHDYLQNMDNHFWQRFMEHHRPYLGKYWSRVIAKGSLDVFRQRWELRWGWIDADEYWSALDSAVRVEVARARVLRQTPVPGFETQEFAQSFRRTLAYLRSRGADVCVITTPVSYEYFTYASRDSGTAAAFGFFRKTAAEYGARYVNFFALFAKPDQDGYFRDQDHLNRLGAPAFTERAIAACFGQTARAVAASAQ